MENKMAELLSDETLKAKIIDLVTEAYDGGYSNGQMRAYSTEETLDIAGEITDLINNQKRLYAESEVLKAISGVAKAVINKGENPQYHDRMMFEVSQKAPVLYSQICNLVGQYKKIERGRVK